MRLEWAVICDDIKTSGEALDLIGVGFTGGVVLTELPHTVTLPVALCLRAEAVDDEGSISVLEYAVTGPDAETVEHGRTPIERWVGTAPRLVDPERYYLPMPVEFAVEQPGLYLVRLWVDPAEPVVLPCAFRVLPGL